MSSHRREVRPRYGRIAVLATSVTVCSVAALAGFGVLGSGSAQAGAKTRPASYTSSPGQTTGSARASTTPSVSARSVLDTDGPGRSPSGSNPSGAASAPTALPADSGTGRRIVFDQSAQRVWLVGARSDDVQRTYLVSGSVTNNLQPGSYSVYSKSRWAVGVDDSGVMQYFVRFTQGPTGAAIGFHSIPTHHGVALQTRAQLGTPQSHGCIRQNLPDAVALWNFAPMGTKVVVVA